eukprot:jgi/Astpho2/3795/Aster-x1172
MKSGGGVLLVGLLQLCIGLVLLGTYEGFKASVCDASGTCLNHGSKRLYMVAEAKRTKIVPAAAGSGLAFNTLTPVFLLSIINNVPLAFVTQSKRRQSDEGIRPYEKAAASFIFFSFCLHLLAVFFALKAIEELKLKSREEYSKVGVLSDTLQFELDH